MDSKMIKVYEGVFTLGEMLTEALEVIAETADAADQAGHGEIAEKLTIGIFSAIEDFLEDATPESMPTLISMMDGVPTERTLEPLQDEVEEEFEEEIFEETGNSVYDNMFKNLYNSSKEMQEAGREFKLDTKEKAEPIVQTQFSLAREGNAPIQPMDRAKVEFDGMENWKSVLNEGAPGAPSGDAGDVVGILSNMNEGDLDTGNMRPTANPPIHSPIQQTEDGESVDPDIMGALAGM